MLIVLLGLISVFFPLDLFCFILFCSARSTWCKIDVFFELYFNLVRFILFHLFHLFHTNSIRKSKKDKTTTNKKLLNEGKGKGKVNRYSQKESLMQEKMFNLSYVHFDYFIYVIDKFRC